MADIFATPPKRREVRIRLHASETADIVKQTSMLEGFSMDDLLGMKEAIESELRVRQQEDNSGKN